MGPKTVILYAQNGNPEKRFQFATMERAQEFCDRLIFAYGLDAEVQ